MRNLPNLVKELNRLHAGILISLLMGLAGFQVLLNVVSASTTEHDDIQKRVCAKTVCTVY